MADLVVIFDPAQEMAAIIDVDGRCGWGPAMIGPQAGDILRAFLDTVPFDVSRLTTHDATTAFLSFLGRAGLDAPAPAPDSAPVAAEPAGGPGVGSDALAQREAVADAAGPPPPAPADTDVEADPGAETAVIRCVNCDGNGMIAFGDGGTTQCGMCRGTGKLTVAGV